MCLSYIRCKTVGVDFEDGNRAGSVTALRAGNVALLRPAEQVFDDMLTGWSAQQVSRMLNPKTIGARLSQVRRFAVFCGSLPWEWSPADVEEWTTELVSGDKPCSHGTIRSYQNAVALFCDYLTDRRYGWIERCEELFGTHPVQVVHDWNTAVHVQQAEADPGKRAFTREELQAFFDYADEQVDRVRARSRKGWLPAFRDAVMFKTAYAYGLRRNEVRMANVTDFGRNPRAREFGEFGVIHVRHGKAMKGSSAKRRSVLTVFAWAPDALAQWVEEVRPLFATAAAGALWPSERATRVGFTQMNTRFRAYREAMGLDRGLDLHSLRRSYVTHLIEDGWDARFVQEQVGHEHASTTSIYTCVSSDYRTTTLRRTLDAILQAALEPERRSQ